MKNTSKIGVLMSVLSLFPIHSFAKVEGYDIHQHYIPQSYKQALLRHG